MKVLILAMLIAISITVNCQTYYIVRHAEKAQPGSGIVMTTPDNPPLSNRGEERAILLKDLLKDKHIRYIFSTNTLRTKSTAKPLSAATGVKIKIYDKPDKAFIKMLKALHNNTLIVGHSDTVDDIVNALCNTENVHGDLPDSQYDNLYVVKIAGKKVSFQAMKYGKPS